MKKMAITKLEHFFLVNLQDGVPMLINKYRAKAEEDIEAKQREAEYLEQRKRAEKELLTDKYSK